MSPDAFLRVVAFSNSILPSFKGIDAIQQAIDNKVTITGCTVHYVQKEVDSGSIIIQAAVPIQEHDNKETLTKKIQQKYQDFKLSVSHTTRKPRSNEIDGKDYFFVNQYKLERRLDLKLPLQKSV